MGLHSDHEAYFHEVARVFRSACLHHDSENGEGTKTSYPVAIKFDMTYYTIYKISTILQELGIYCFRST